MANTDPIISTVTSLGLEDPSRYTAHAGEDWQRWSPVEADRRAEEDPESYRRYVDHSCDLTMRGGTTSGVIYPLAVCSLAQHYVFRSVGGASAGAIAAAATAAAEYGRNAEQPDSVPDGSVRPGFAGLAGLVGWFISGTGAARWRLPQLFQPTSALHRMYRLIIATMQSERTTGRSRFVSIAVALVCAVRPPTRVTLALVALGWLAGPAALAAALPASNWAGVPTSIAALATVLAAAAAFWALWAVAAKVPGTTVASLVPLLVAAGVLAFSGEDAALAAWLTVSSVVVGGWLVLTLAMLAVLAVLYLGASWPLLTDTERFDFGLVPGAVPYRPNWIDRAAGMPAPTGVPPLATWLADRIDDLAGRTPGPDGHTRALTFGDLWTGPGSSGVESRSETDLHALDMNTGLRSINLALMSTDLTAGRPFRLPFAAATTARDRWQYCPECLDGILPARVIRQLEESGTADVPCPRHARVTLRWLPQPWDLPVVLGVRMSLSMPGLICPVPLCREGKVHWFSDGGITSNFPIHFFDTLLPRWPTFGLNLESLERQTSEDEQVYLPKQDSSREEEPVANLGSSVFGFAGAILNTFLDWRDTMQSGLPGFRGRIANVRQGEGEGGMNLFMPPEVIATLALRGFRAGEALKHRFTTQEGGESEGFTQTDRYRWIRLRLAIREYRELARTAKARGPLYTPTVSGYQIPEELAGWFDDRGEPWPRPEPYAEPIKATFDELGKLADTHLEERFDGTPAVNPALRLTPQE